MNEITIKGKPGLEPWRYGLPAGWPCRFRRSESDEGLPAQVMENAGGGFMKLWVPALDGQPVTKNVTYLHNDEFFSGQRTKLRQDDGAWDYIPGFPSPNYTVIDPNAPNETEQRILDLFEGNGMQCHEIAEELGNGWQPHAIANVIYRFRPALKAQAEAEQAARLQQQEVAPAYQ